MFHHKFKPIPSHLVWGQKDIYWVFLNILLKHTGYAITYVEINLMQNLPQHSYNNKIINNASL